MQNLFSSHDEFIITIEVVPPEGNDPEQLLKKLALFADLPFHAFSVASNPVAKPKMSAMVFTHLIQEVTKKPAILHFTIRDHNRLGLQSELWGAKALGINTVIAVPARLRQEMENTKDPMKAGIEQAKQMLEFGKSLFAGACIMPPFDRFDILPDIF